MTHTPSTQTAHRFGIAAITRMALVAGAAILAAVVTTPTSANAAISSSTLFSLKNPNITESSGIVAAGGIYFTHNDGPVNQFFAVDRLGHTLAVYNTPGIPKFGDWEDVAAGTDGAGHPALFFGAIGDNSRNRPEIAVIRVNRPVVNVAKTGVVANATGITRYRFAYPDGPKDAESLAVQPGTNRIFIVSKAAGGGVYEAPANPSTTALNKLVKIGTVTVTGATAADFSPDGKKFVVRQYKNAAIYRVANNNVAAAIKTAPVAFAMPSQRQGEAITFGPTGTTLILSSEGQYTPVLTMISPV
ncbi:MAG: hypothetical protein QOJ50_3063 [Cryptosporangiaceae bacterium]|nr:hypothetical protein [Cryptosporangiaceae bacterium]